jgi:methionine sulfoxide reductase catalytic subunit
MKDPITPEATYLSRRTFMRGAIAVGSVAATGLLTRALLPRRQAATPPLGPLTTPVAPEGDALTSWEDITTYNNFYEFSTDKGGVAPAAAGFVTKPWQVAVGGLVGKPRVFDLDDLKRLASLEERVYRLRCVEGWSMVIPWLGFPLQRVLDAVSPLGSAKYVKLTTLLDPERMPLQKRGFLDWPYVEGLRLDEARHDLTLLAFGLYGRELPPQNGAPLRLVVPWKYGFKSVKSIVSIDLVEDRPLTTWQGAAPEEYGFYANVNPAVSHPRWSQATERRIGEIEKRDTLPFNGYGAEVASLYAGMDLRVSY